MNHYPRGKAITTIFCIYMVIGILSESIFAQTVKPDQTSDRDLKFKFNLAQRLEAQGQTEQALEIYKFLVDAQPINYSYYASYVNLLFQKADFPELERVITRFLSLNPKFENVAVDLGRLYYVKGDTTRAFDYWSESLKRFNHSLSFYQTLFNALVNLRQLDRAENLLYEARTFYQKSDLFSFELANFLMARGEYIKSAEEYLRYWRSNPRNIGFVTSQLLKIPNEPSIANGVDSLIVLAMSEGNNLSDLHQLRSELNFKFHRYDIARQEVLIVESMTGYKGNAILDLANDLVNEGEYQQAERCYSEILQRNEFLPQVPKALLGIANATEKLVLTKQNLNPLRYFYPDNLFFNAEFVQVVIDDEQQLPRIFAIYDSLIISLPKSAYSAQALYRLAELRFFVMRDFDGAYWLYEQASQVTHDTQLLHLCRLQIGKILLSKGDPASAANYFDQEAVRSEGTDIEKKYRSYELLANFLSGDVETVIKKKNEVLGLLGPKHEFFNDVLELTNFIEENYINVNETGKEAFRKFISGELLLRQNKLTEAEKVYHYIVTEYPHESIRSAAQFRLAQVFLIFNPAAEAESLISDWIGSSDEYADALLFMLAETGDKRDHDLVSAVSWYEFILEKYPESYYCDLARECLREILKVQIP